MFSIRGAPSPPGRARPSLEPVPWTKARDTLPPEPDRRADARRWAGPAAFCVAVGAAIAVVVLVMTAVARAEVGPNRNLELNHSIEMAVLEGWPHGSTVRVEVFRGPTRIAWHDAHITTVGNRGGTVYDVNHVGGEDCWNGVPSGTTPDVQPGDLVRATALGLAGTPTSDVDRTFVKDVAFTESGGTLVGHARGVETGGAFDLTRPVSLGDSVLMEAKRVGAPVDGETVFGPQDIGAGGEFRKSLPGTPNAGEVFIDTIETTTHASGAEGSGITVAFPSDAEPERPCGALATSALTSFTVAGVPVEAINRAVLDSGAPLLVGGPRLLAAQTADPGDADVTVTLRLNGVTVPVSYDGAAWSASITHSVLAALPDGVPVTLQAAFSDGSPPQTRRLLKDVTAPVVTASVPPGTYTSAQEVALAADGREQVRYTLDGSDPASGTSTPYDGRPVSVDRTRTIRAYAVDAAGNRGDASFAYAIVAATGQAGAASVAVTASPGAIRSAFALQGLTMRRVLRLRQVRRSGLVANLRLPSGTRVIDVRILRGGRRVAHVVRRVRSGATRYRLRLRSPALRRGLRPGRYRLRVRVGPSRRRLGPAAERAFRIR